MLVDCDYCNLAYHNTHNCLKADANATQYEPFNVDAVEKWASSSGMMRSRTTPTTRQPTGRQGRPSGFISAVVRCKVWDQANDLAGVGCANC